MKYLGIDYGTKRIGVAQSDEGGMIAFPLATVTAGTQAVQEVAQLALDNRIEKIVIGESKNFAGEANAVMKDIEQFKAALAEATKLPVEYEPEFMTSAQAARQGLDKRGEGNKKEDIDASAAALILQAFLDRK
ncbi:MAG: Holliday junction resolvase RuvX [Candidatus Pacebacteria bacterium]|nr:Holliday junction resolvase RuvX [Candidatus Paceibacterota bacterium]